MGRTLATHPNGRLAWGGLRWDEAATLAACAVGGSPR